MALGRRVAWAACARTHGQADGDLVRQADGHAGERHAELQADGAHHHEQAAHARAPHQEAIVLAQLLPQARAERHTTDMLIFSLIHAKLVRFTAQPCPMQRQGTARH